MSKEYIQFQLLKKQKEIIHLYSKKPININYSMINKKQVNDLFKKIEKDFDYKFKTIKGCNQVHSDKIVIIDENNINEEFNNCDGLITNLTDTALIIKTADCQNIFLYDPKKKVIANVHSGWKGTLNKIVIKCIDLMVKKFNSNVSDIIVCISPSIKKCCFELDKDVYMLFKKTFPNIDNFCSYKKINGLPKYYIDTIKLNIELLKDYNIDEKNIEVSNLCTKCNHNMFHSYRYDKEKSGRNLGLIVIKKQL